MRDEYDFSQAERGKFYNQDARLNLPVYLDDEVREFVAKVAARQNTDLSQAVNDLLRSDMNLAKARE